MMHDENVDLNTHFKLYKIVGFGLFIEASYDSGPWQILLFFLFFFFDETIERIIY